MVKHGGVIFNAASQFDWCPALNENPTVCLGVVSVKEGVE